MEGVDSMNICIAKLTICKLGGGDKFTYLLTNDKYNCSKVLGN